MEVKNHIGIIYQIRVSDLNLKNNMDDLDSEGAYWYKVSDLLKEDLSPFAIYSIEKLGYKLK